MAKAFHKNSADVGHRREEANTNEELSWDGMAAGGDLTTTRELRVSKPRKRWGSKLKAVLSEENLMESSSPPICPSAQVSAGPTIDRT